MLKLMEVEKLQEIPWKAGVKFASVPRDQKWPDDTSPSDAAYHVEIKAPMTLRGRSWIIPSGIYAVIDYRIEVGGEEVRIRRIVHETDPHFVKVVKEMGEG